MNRAVGLTLFLLMASGFFVPVQNNAFCDVVDAVVAIVNDDAITQSEVDMMIAPVYEKLVEEYEGRELLDKLNQVREDALQKLIEERLILQEAKKINITVDDADVEEKLEEVRSRFSSPEEFEKALETEGITIEDLKEKYRERIIVSILTARKVRRKIFISPSEVAAYYNGHKDQFEVPESAQVWNILIRTTEGNDDKEAEKQATRIWKMIQAGADFSSMARKYSQGPFAEKGGYMGFVKKNQLMPELDKIIFNLEEGKISNIIKSKLGYHIFRVDEKIPARMLRMDEVKDQIEDMLFAKKAEVEYLKWVNDLKENAYVNVKEE